MTAWHKTAPVCGLLLLLGVALAGCSSSAPPPAASGPSTTTVTKGKSTGGTGGATPDLSDKGAPTGAKTGDYSGGQGRSGK